MTIQKIASTPDPSRNGAVIWMTGLSGAGKSTLANALFRWLDSIQEHSIILDGDLMRGGLNSDLGYTVEDRDENVRRIAHVAELFKQQGFIVIVALISPTFAQRANARKIIGEGFIEVFVNSPLSTCERRDRKGLYARARRGEIPNFTGVSSLYEEPLNPELILNTSSLSIEASVNKLIEVLGTSGFVQNRP
ncbi:adenylyl-sulfate kinase [Caballeronia sp. S22]|uniref:adenylyl-sulfate kinase n=1 Tax=Caballeronia sp. S22 TaxID=3137182 RepID=UPI003530B815